MGLALYINAKSCGEIREMVEFMHEIETEPVKSMGDQRIAISWPHDALKPLQHWMKGNIEHLSEKLSMDPLDTIYYVIPSFGYSEITARQWTVLLDVMFEHQEALSPRALRLSSFQVEVQAVLTIYDHFEGELLEV